MQTAILLSKPEFEALIEGAVKKALSEVQPRYVHPAQQLLTENSELLSQSQAAKLLQVSKPTFIKLRKEGAFEGREVGRRMLYKRSDLLAYIESLPVKGVRQHPNLKK